MFTLFDSVLTFLPVPLVDAAAMVDEAEAVPSSVCENGEPSKVKKYPLLLADFNDKLMNWGWHTVLSNSAVHAVFDNDLAVGGRFMCVCVCLLVCLSLALLSSHAPHLFGAFVFALGCHALRDIDIDCKEAAAGLVIIQAAARSAIGPPMDIQPESICGSLLQNASFIEAVLSDGAEHGRAIQQKLTSLRNDDPRYMEAVNHSALKSLEKQLTRIRQMLTDDERHTVRQFVTETLSSNRMVTTQALSSVITCDFACWDVPERLLVAERSSSTESVL